MEVLDEMKAGNDEDNSMESKKIEMEQKKDIALVVHDNKKSVFYNAKMKIILITLSIFFLIIMPRDAFAFGEVFVVETNGTEYCGDFKNIMFGPRNNVNLWMNLLSETQIIFSFTPTFEPGTTFDMTVSTYLTSKTNAALVGRVSLENSSYATIQAMVFFDKFGTVKGMKGTLIQYGVLHPSCFSSGTFWTKNRIQ